MAESYLGSRDVTRERRGISARGISRGHCAVRTQRGGIRTLVGDEAGKSGSERAKSRCWATSFMWVCN